MKGSFAVEEVTCISHLLDTVSHGNAIIAEILRLKDNIPQIFRLETKEDQSKYGDVVIDFSYFKNSETIEKKISNNPNLQDLFDEFKENYLSIITRFYSAFESIYQYITDLNSFFEQLIEGSFIQQSLDNVLQDNEGKQLLCESVYLFGCMLMICEAYIPGNVRERLLVAYHRMAVSHHQTNLDSTCKLLGDSNYRNNLGAKRPANYPDELFKRIPIDASIIEIIIGRLRSEDVYNQLNIYPMPDHRSTALATQGAMLVVCLFFSTDILMSENAKMREIVDKYFPDNWVVSLYMGITINLIDIWEPYKAAKAALMNTINAKNVKEISQKHVAQMDKLYARTNKLVHGEALEEEKLLENINKILSLNRECNVTLRWLMIHTTPPIFVECGKKARQIREQLISDSKFDPINLFNFLINTSLLEYDVKNALKKSLDNKELKWNEQQKDTLERINDLCEVFSGAKPLARVPKNDNLCNWFKAISRQIETLDREDTTLVTKKIIQLIQALEDVQEFHQLDDIMQVKQWLLEARNNLKDMIRGGGVTEDSLVALQICTDLSYGWYAARTFIDLGREALRKQPTVVSHLRVIFLKLASALEIPLLRINQAGSADLLSVSQYYSNELVKYVKEVLQVIPETVFRLLEKIIELQTSVIKELPTKLEKDKLKDFAQLDERMEIAKLTHHVSIFTSGILKMRSTLVGVIRIDPKQLLEDGIRCEVSKLAKARMISSLCVNNSSGTLSNRLSQLANHMDGFRRSFEYIQDYINIHGLKIWQEEVSTIISQSIEEDCVKVSRVKSTQTLLLQGRNTIFTCLVQDLFSLADPKTTLYVEHNGTWYDYKSHKETLKMSNFSLIQQGIGASGLFAVGRLIGCCTSARLGHLSDLIQKIIPQRIQIESGQSQLAVVNRSKHYSQVSSKLSKFWPQMLDWVLDIGTSQLIQRHINYQLNTSSKFDSTHLEASLRAVNKSILHDIKKDVKNFSLYYSELLPELKSMLQRVGISDTYSSVYISTQNNHNIAEIVLLFVISQLPKMEFFKNTGGLIARRFNTTVDGTPFLIGIVSFLNQFHEFTTAHFTILLCQYIVSCADVETRGYDLPNEVHISLKFLEGLCRVMKIPQSFVECYIPLNILTQQQFLVSKTI